jgi:hypothetical protein
MKRLANYQSTHWRATTSHTLYGVDYNDYVRGRQSVLDITSDIPASACSEVEYVNIRGHNGTSVKVSFWQVDNSIILNIDSSWALCPFTRANTGSKPSENNFGFYCEGDSTLNPNFRGMKNDESTTEWWFGGHL